MTIKKVTVAKIDLTDEEKKDAIETIDKLLELVKETAKKLIESNTIGGDPIEHIILATSIIGEEMEDIGNVLTEADKDKLLDLLQNNDDEGLLKMADEIIKLKGDKDNMQ